MSSIPSRLHTVALVISWGWAVPDFSPHAAMSSGSASKPAASTVPTAAAALRALPRQDPVQALI